MLTIEQISKLKQFLEEAKCWSKMIELDEERFIDNANITSNSWYKEKYEKCYDASNERMKQIEAIEEIFGL